MPRALFLVAGLLMGLVGGIVFESVTSGVGANYAEDSFEMLTRQRDEAARFAGLLAEYGDARSALDQFEEETGYRRFEKGAFIVIGELAFRFDSDQLIAVCTDFVEEPHDSECHISYSEPQAG